MCGGGRFGFFVAGFVLGILVGFRNLIAYVFEEGRLRSYCELVILKREHDRQAEL